MKKFLVIVLLAGLFGKVAGQPGSIEKYLAKAPFKMAVPATPVFPSKTFVITDYSAKPDGITLNTQAFESAISACEKAGGGTVLVPPGVWLTGPIVLRSNVNLHAERGAIVIFTNDHEQFPMIKPKGSSSYMVQPPIYGDRLQNIAITGEGIFDGNGESWRPLKKEKATEKQWKEFVASGGVVSKDGKIWWPSAAAMEGEAYLKTLKDKKDATAEDWAVARDFLRPKMLVFTNCGKVLLDGPTFKNSPNFVINPQRCTDLTIQNVQVNNEWWAQNGDGIDISACRNVAVFNCTVNAGDDGICMKSSNGKDPAIAELENILIADCIVYKGHGGFVIGSNTDGGMKNIFVTNCSFIGTDIGIRVKSNAGRGGLVKDIFIQDIFMKDIQNEAISFDTYYEDVPAGKTLDSVRTTLRDKTPLFRDFHISNVVCLGAKQAITITGLPEMPVQRLYFENITIHSTTGADFTAAADIILKQVKIIPVKGPVYKVNNTKGVTIVNGSYTTTDKFLTADENVSDISISGTPVGAADLRLGDKVQKGAVEVKP